jgi:hypothetical protein
MSKLTVKRTERGWAGHFICSYKCLFRRNTLLECGDVRLVVSTVGGLRTAVSPPETIGYNRYYETMVFPACYEDPYWEADTARGEISFESNWAIDHIGRKSAGEANDMHEAVVDEMTARLEAGETFTD